MSGHSHWHNIQLTKGKTDVKRAQMFSKFAKSIVVAARDGGGDPAYNFKLRMAVEAAKAVSMTRDNIDRAIQRGAGGGEGTGLKEAVYEGFGPGGVAFIVTCLTDNPTRTVATVKHIASRNGGSIGASGSVAWMFQKKAVIIFDQSEHLIMDRDSFELAMIDAGADDIRHPLIEEEGNGEGVDIIQVIGEVKNFAKLMEAVEKMSLKLLASSIEYIPKETTSVYDPEAKAQTKALFEALEENEDVDAVYTNEA